MLWQKFSVFFHYERIIGTLAEKTYTRELKEGKGRSAKLVHNDEELKVVQMIFDWYVHGNSEKRKFSRAKASFGVGMKRSKPPILIIILTHIILGVPGIISQHSSICI